MYIFIVGYGTTIDTVAALLKYGPELLNVSKFDIVANGTISDRTCTDKLFNTVYEDLGLANLLKETVLVDDNWYVVEISEADAIMLKLKHSTVEIYIRHPTSRYGSCWVAFLIEPSAAFLAREARM